jgi:hypothetical protein
MSVLDQASLVAIPSGYKAGTIFSQVPTDGAGDLDYDCSTTSTRINESGLLKNVDINVPNVNFKGNCGKFLFEGQDTNFSTHNITLDSSTWTIFGNRGTTTLNAAISPDGTFNATKITPSNFNTRFMWFNLGSTRPTNFLSISVYAKAGGLNKIAVRESNNTGQYASFDLSNGTIIDNGGNEATIEALTNGWYRCEVSIESGNTSNKNIGLCPLDDAYSGGQPFSYYYQGNGVDGVYVYGTQFLTHKYNTSLILTTTVAVTRAKGESETNITTSSGINGTVFFNISNLKPFYIGNQPNNIIINFFESGSSVLYLFLTDTVAGNPFTTKFRASNGFLTNDVDIVAGDNKMAIAWTGTTEVVVYVNGVSIATVINFPSTFTIDKIEFQTSNFLGNSRYEISEFYQSNDRLTNAQLEKLTIV